MWPRLLHQSSNMGGSCDDGSIDSTSLHASGQLIAACPRPLAWLGVNPHSFPPTVQAWSIAWSCTRSSSKGPSGA